MKKVTLFVDKTLRDELERADKKWSAAYGSALTFWSKLIAYGSDPAGNSVRHGWPCESAHAKFICGCHSESNDVVTAFKQAHRIEACVTLRFGNFGVLTFEVMTYRAGEMTSSPQFLRGILRVS